MLNAEITDLVSKPSYGERSELIGLLCDSLDDDSVDDMEEGSITTARRRRAEMKSGDDPGMSVDEFWAAVKEDRAKR